MQQWITKTLIVIGILGICYWVLNGRIAWQMITMIIATFAAPFKALFHWANSTDDDRRREHHEAEAEYQQQITNKQQIYEARMHNLEARVKRLDQSLQQLAAQKEIVVAETNQMTLNELQKEGRRFWGVE